MYQGFRHFFRFSTKNLLNSNNKIFLATPLLLTIPQINSFFWSSKQRNQMKGRVHIGVQVSNKPCEDRSSTLQLQSIDGYAFAVFDGHGGWQVSQLCSKMLLNALDNHIKKNKENIKDEQQLIQKSLKDAFETVQNYFLQRAQEGYKIGFGKFARAGSCALVCVVYNDKIYSANAGDSLGLIIEQDQQTNMMKYVELNRELNANKQFQQERLKKLFPNQSDIVVCKRNNNTACYVKGRLQPTRSLGDLRLKHQQFNNPEGLGTQYEFQSKLKTFSGPYITWQPQILVFPLKKSYKSVVLASDGLWDELQRQQVAQLFKSNPIKQMPSLLIQRALEKAALDSKLTVEKIRQIPAGKKRKIHDDITVVVVDLQSQV